ncbi:MAG: hypothetical protein AAB534_00790 [Patescibacteria group bacterium]
MSIKNITTKIKGFWQSDTGLKDKALTIVVIVLVGTASFGLGRLSAFESKKEPVTIEMQEFKDSDSEVLPSGSKPSSAKSNPTVLGENISKEGGEVVASKTGDKYHFPWCSGAKRITEANKVYFKSIEEAKAAGLTPAGNCKGLK